MRMRVIAVGTRMPSWVDALFADYARRLRPVWPISLQEIAAARRGSAGARSDAERARAVALEGERLLGVIEGNEFVVALDERGRELASRELAAWLAKRVQEGRKLAFILGGADGLAPAVLARSNFTWSLSRLTLPHALARVLLIEQLYRAHTLLSGHPYHRE